MVRSRRGASLGLAGAIAIGCLVAPAGSSAQSLVTPQPPGPYVIDLRGTMVGVPGDPAFFPPVDEVIPIPARGFGFDVGAHIYPFSLGPARIGIGAAYMHGRGTVPEPGAIATVSALAPQLSFNFGSRGGWSYLSVGYGNLRVKSELTGDVEDSDDVEPADEDLEAASPPVMAPTVPREADSGSLGSLNVGGGARWFLSRHLGIGFDIRFHRVAPNTGAGTPGVTVVSTSVGFSIR